MNFNKNIRPPLTSLIFSCLLVNTLAGATVAATYTGTLTAESGTPGSVVVEMLNLPTTASVTIFTTSYGGGTNLDNTVTAAGGFQPSVTLFDTTGFAVASENGMFSPLNNSWDAYIQDPSVPAGDYFVILTDQANQVSPAFTGFGNTSPSNFYTFFSGPGGANFTDVQGNARTGNYALDVAALSSSSPNSVPEPATVGLMGSALLGAVMFLRKRRLSL